MIDERTESKKEEGEENDDNKDDEEQNDDKKDDKTDDTAPVVPVDTPTGKTDDEILTGPPPETPDALISSFNQLFDNDPGAALTYLFDNLPVLFMWWWILINLPYLE